MNKIIISMVLATVGTTVYAAPANLPYGTNLTYGFNSNPQSILSNTNNPAAASAALRQEETQFRMGILSSVGVGLEVGQVDNFIDDIDAFDQTINDLDIKEQAGTLTVQDIDDANAQFDDLLTTAATDGYFKVTAGIEVPFIGPLVVGGDSLGSFTLDANVYVTGRLGLLHDALVYNPVAQTFQANTALYVKAGQMTEISLGYGRQVVEYNGGNVFAGIRARVLNASMIKAVAGLETTNDAEQYLEDTMDKGTLDSSSVTFDLGALWVGEHYRYGLTMANITSPEFAYPSLGQNCASAGTQDDIGNCYTALSFGDQINLTESFVLDPQLTVEAAIYTESRNWVFNVAYDANAINDLVGDQYQWMTASAAYTGGLWIPGARFSLRKNMAGEKLSYAGLGFTFFKVLNLDLMAATDKVTVDGSEIPRAVAFNLGLEINF